MPTSRTILRIFSRPMRIELRVAAFLAFAAALTAITLTIFLLADAAASLLVTAFTSGWIGGPAAVLPPEAVIVVPAVTTLSATAAGLMLLASRAHLAAAGSFVVAALSQGFATMLYWATVGPTVGLLFNTLLLAAPVALLAAAAIAGFAREAAPVQR